MTSPSPVPDPPLQLRPDVTDVNDDDASAQREELVAEIRRLKEEKLRAVEAFRNVEIWVVVSNIFLFFTLFGEGFQKNLGKQPGNSARLICDLFF